jgi:hypothetical protein
LPDLAAAFKHRVQCIARAGLTAQRGRDITNASPALRSLAMADASQQFEQAANDIKGLAERPVKPLPG